MNKMIPVEIQERVDLIEFTLDELEKEVFDTERRVMVESIWETMSEIRKLGWEYHLPSRSLKPLTVCNLEIKPVLEGETADEDDLRNTYTEWL